MGEAVLQQQLDEARALLVRARELFGHSHFANVEDFGNFGNMPSFVVAREG